MYTDTFVLTADTANGIEKHDLMDFVAFNPGHEFVRAQDFIEYLDNLGVGEVVAAIFDPMTHADVLRTIEYEYGIE